MTTFCETMNDYGLLMVRDEKGKIILDMDGVEVVHHFGLGGQVIIDDVLFYGANLNFYHDDREHIDILSSWGWNWNDDTNERVPTSIQEMPEDLQNLLVVSLAKRLSE